MIKTFIITSKSLYFFIYAQAKIIRCYFNFITNKKAKTFNICKMINLQNDTKLNQIGECLACTEKDHM